MPVKLNSIVKLLNKELKIKDIEDQSKNGLQVRASNQINKVGLTTDASMDSFKKAKQLGCELLIVHHGIIWKGQNDTANLVRKKIDFLKKNHISLYVAHLPLDKSKKYGHNTYILGLLNAKPKKAFGHVGYIGYLNKPKSIDLIVKDIENKLDTKCKVWGFGKKQIKSVAAISGSGSTLILDAIKSKVDLLVTGEVTSWNYYDAKEGKLNVILAGHYKTETSGVVAIGNLLEQKFGLKTKFIDLPTGL